MKLSARAAILTVLAGAATAISPPLASAARDLPLPAFGDIAVDDTAELVYISGGPSSNGIVVTDFSGRVKRTIANQPGATGLELSADGTRLYVALAAGDAVSAIDTRTFAEAARYPTGAGTCPAHLARTGEVFWYGYGCTDGNWSGKIGKLDPAANPPAEGDKQGSARFQRAPLVTANGAADGTVVAGQLALSLSTVQTYTAGGGALTAKANGDVVGAGLTDLDLSPDGTTFYSAAGSRDRVEAFASADLARRGAYTTRPRPNAVAVSADGGHLATGALTTDAKDVLIYQNGGITPVETVALDSGETVAPRGLAWTSDQERLFVVTQHNNQPEPALEVVYHPVD